MSFYRTAIAVVAAMGLASTVFAADETTTTNTTMQNPTEQTTANTTDQATTKVDINKADVKQLTKVNGLNGAKAKAIVNYRKKHGDFKSLDELKEVKAFKNTDEKTLKEIQDQLTIG